MEEFDSEEQVSVGELLRPDNSNLKRGFTLVALAVALGVFISLSVLEPAEDGVSTETVAAPTVSVSEPETPTTTVATTNATTSTTTPTTATATTELEETTTTVATTAATTTTAPALTRSETVVRVFNDAGFAGVGALGTRIVSNAGFDTVSPTDAPEPDQVLSQVLYGPGFEDFATEIAGALNISTGQVQALGAGNRPINDVDGIDIVVVVGRNENLPR